MRNICLAGDGWGAVSALSSLQRTYTSLSVVTSDEGVLCLLRSRDFHVESFEPGGFDFVVCAGYKPFIPKKVLDKQHVINIHYSLLPKYRGMHSTVWAIMNGENELGLTIHRMNEFMDDGDIIDQHVIPYVDQTATDIMNACNVYIEMRLGDIVESYLSGEIKPVSQSKDKATWVCKRNLDDCLIDFNESSQQINRFFKALVSPYPLPMIKVKDSYYEVIDYKICENAYVMTNGRVVNIDNDGAWIKISDGLLVVRKLRLYQSSTVFDASKVLKIGVRLT